jgi:uncharacterized protein with PIN domain
MKFIADRMLGKLARLLRTIGYDAEYVRNAELKDIEDWCANGSVFLTRGKKFDKVQIKGVYCVEENYPVHQLKEIILKFNLTLNESKFFTRCLECNKELIPAPDEDVQRRVPEYVRRTRNTFYLCPECRRIYWEGSHRTHMQEMIDRIRNEIESAKKQN